MSAQDRPSRQDLVVPPRRSSLPVALGALAMGCAGFGLVWFSGLGRPAADVRDLSAMPAAVADDPATSLPPVEPRPFPGGDEAMREVPVADRWQPRGSAAGDERAIEDRLVHRSSLDGPAAVSDASVAERPLSRFSAADARALPSGASPEDAEEPAASGRSAVDSVVTSAETAAGDADAVLPDSPPHAGPDDQASAEPDRDVVEPPGVATGTDTAVADDAEDLPAGGRESAPAEAGSAFASPFAAAPAVPLPPPAIPVHPSARPALPERPAAPPPVVQGATAAVPFAAAPPLAPGLGQAVPPAGRPSQPRPEASGQGRPGPLQLEGIQAAQLAVEKRGPKEVQVGKAARYEIVVRNAGSVAAHDVTLRDAIPSGTALITTVPPANPVATASGGTADGELVWPLGTLDPGGQVCVVVEVMPQQEGEIGSVASVSFRADASVRSRATKPALSIEAREPAPVLIGRDTQLTITVSNPGSGVATGVVLEGFLPENVSHRAGSELEFDVGQLRPGESRTIDLVLGTRGPGVQAARFVARADGGVEAEQATKLSVTAPTLALEVDMPLRRFLQRPATCVIAMTNAGTAPARAIELAAQLPPGMKFVRANNAGWHDDRTHRVLWNLEELPPGETGTVEVVVMPIALGQQRIAAAARSADGLADQATHVCEVEGLAAISFEVVDSEDPIEVDGVTEYVIRVANQGTKPATAVRVTASLLGDLEPVEAQGPAAHRLDQRAVVFEPLVKLAPAEEAVFRVRARGRRAGEQRVQVQVVSEDHAAPITKEEITRVYADR